MSWATGFKQATNLPSGVNLARQAADEARAADKVKPTTRRVMGEKRQPGTWYTRSALADRGEAIRNRILAMERTLPRNRAERRQKEAIIRELETELAAIRPYHR